MDKKYYAVQVCEENDYETGSTVKREALRMAKAAAKENPLKEVRIYVRTEEDDFCQDIIIVQEGAETEAEFKLLQAYQKQYFALRYKNYNFNDGDDLIAAWGTAYVRPFSSAAERDAFCQDDPQAVPITFERAMYITDNFRYNLFAED